MRAEEALALVTVTVVVVGTLAVTRLVVAVLGRLRRRHRPLDGGNSCWKPRAAISVLPAGEQKKPSLPNAARTSGLAASAPRTTL